MSVTNLLRSGVTMLITPNGRSVENTPRSEILVENGDFFIAHLQPRPSLGGLRLVIATFGTEKLQWCGYATVKKSEDMFIRFDRIHEHGIRTYRRTDRHRATAYRVFKKSSPQKNVLEYFQFG